MTSIQDSSPPLTLLAGDRALARIREQGLAPEDVTMMPGAAGGPKALGIQGLDLALFGEWLPRAPRPRSLIGSSIGSWRFASACMSDPVAGLERLGELYTIQRFPKGVTKAEVSRKCSLMLEQLLEGEEENILNNADYHLQVVVAQSRGLMRSDQAVALALGLLGTITLNAMHRPWLKQFFERIILHDPRSAPSLGPYTDMPGRHEHLTLENLRQALLASGSIPGVMEAVAEISGIDGRDFRDGGLVDYHLDLPYETDGIVLYPHFTPKVVPGWFDKMLPWRGPDRERMQDVLLLAPSEAYLERLPHGKLPDRKDFTRYEGDDAGREKYWRLAMTESRRMGDYFIDMADTGRLGEIIQPLFPAG